MGSFRSSQRRSRPIAVESLEGRALLSTVISELPPAVPAQFASASGTSSQIHVDGFPVHPTIVHPPAHPAQVKVNKAHASDFVSVAKQYLKTTFSSATGKVGWSYVKAAVRGDGKTLKSLGSTSAVKQVGQSFKNLGSLTQTKAVGNSFQNFGTSVYRQYHKTIK